MIHEPRRIPELVRTAFRQALSGRPGPVPLDVPQDVLGALVEFDDAAFDITPANYRPTGRMQAEHALIVEATSGHRPTPAALAWRDQITQIRASYPAKLSSMMAGTDLPMHPAALAHEVGRRLPAVLDCRVKFVPHPAMPDFSKMGRYGM